MHVHLPKPLHGWREFLHEVGIIVLGVLIALGAEQLLSDLRDRSAAREARDNIRAEITENLSELASRDATNVCIERRLGEVAALIARSQQAGYRRPSWIGRPQVWPMIDAKWSAAAGAGRATLLSPSELADYGVIYRNLALLQQVEMEEQTTWAHLRALEQLDRVPADAVVPLTMALTEARLDSWLARIHFRRSLVLAARLGIRPGAMPYVGSRSVCLPINMPRAMALRQTLAQSGPENYFGEP